jgi:hypothetical protein
MSRKKVHKEFPGTHLPPLPLYQCAGSIMERNPQIQQAMACRVEHLHIQDKSKLQGSNNMAFG